MTGAGQRPAALDVAGLTVSYGRQGRRLQALSDVSFRIERGETYGLVGESGSGKSTLALALMRHLPRAARVDGGRVLLGGDDLLRAPERTLRRWRARRIALVPQGGAALNPSLQIGTQIGEVYRAHAGMLPAEAAEASARMLNEVRVGDPARILGRYPHELSAGQQQRVLIAMALAANPDILLLDEPTTALDATVEAEVLDLIEALQGEVDAAILLISHDLRVVARLCDRVGMLYAGRLLEEGPGERLVRTPRHPYTLALLRCVPRLDADGRRPERLEPIPGRAPELGAEIPGCVFADRCPIARPRCQAETPPAYPVADDWTSRCHYHADVPAITAGASAANSVSSGPNGAPLLHVESVSKTYRAGAARIEAVADVSFDLGHGEVLGLVGESGSGKTSLARCLAGLAEPSAGSLELDGHDVAWSHRERPHEARRAVQMVFQNPDGALNRAVTVGGILRRSLRRLATDGKDADAALRDLAALVRLSPGDLELRPGALSGGMKQRVAIARSFAGSPRLVICDEPVSDLDVSVQVAILNLVRDLREREGVSYLFISHDLAVVRYVSDRIAVMYLGSLVELGPAASFTEPPHHPYTEALISAVPALPTDEQRPRITLYGPLPSPSRPPTGCRFHTRCPRFLGEVCRSAPPPWQDDGRGRRYRCHIAPDALAGVQRADRLAGRPPTRAEPDRP